MWNIGLLTVEQRQVSMETLKKHLPEYLMEAAELGLLIVSASVFTVLFEYPYSPMHQAIALVYSPWGKQSGAHMNPAITLTFYRADKVKRQDAIFYIVFRRRAVKCAKLHHANYKRCNFPCSYHQQQPIDLSDRFLNSLT
jgi:hypothetical protein